MAETPAATTALPPENPKRPHPAAESAAAETRAPERSSFGRILGVIGLLAVILVAFLVAFALPGLRAEPSDVPVALVAPEAVAAQLTERSEQLAPGTIAWTPADDADDALRMIREREVVGALVVGANGLTVEAPSAAGAAVAALVTQLGEQIGDAVGTPVTISDPVPFTEADPRGIGLSAGAFPIALGGWIAAVGIIAVVRGSRRRVLAALGFAVVGGAAMTAVLQFWFGTFDGNYLALAAAGMLGIAATSMLVLGLQRLLRGAGIACAAIVLILLGNPLSGLSTATELLTAPWGKFGQLLPPGATGALLRNVGFFEVSTVWGPIGVLVVWIVFGAVAYGLGGVRERREAHREGSGAESGAGSGRSERPAPLAPPVPLGVKSE